MCIPIPQMMNYIQFYMMGFLSEDVGNILGKRENLFDWPLCIFPTVFSKTIPVKAFHSLPNDKILELSKIETNCRRHFKVRLKWKISTIKGSNFVRKGEIACYK